MPEFSEILDTALQAVANSTDRQELERLKAHVQAVKDLGGAAPGPDTLVKLLDSGYLPDYNQAAEAEISASLAMSTDRKRVVDAGGTVSFGPVALRGDFSSSLGQTTATNLQVTIKMERRLVSEAYANLLKPFGDSGAG